MRTPAETGALKREVVDAIRGSLVSAPSKDTAILLALVRVRQLLDIIYPPAPRNDMADAVALAMTPWQADAGDQQEADTSSA